MRQRRLGMILGLLLIVNAAAFSELITITKTTVALVRVRKTMSAVTRSIPPHVLYTIQGYDYLITIRMVATQPVAADDSTLYVVCFLPGGVVTSVPIRMEQVKFFTDRDMEYSFPIFTKEEGFSGFTISTEDELQVKHRPAYYIHTNQDARIFLDKGPAER